jgi:hypothetical protein
MVVRMLEARSRRVCAPIRLRHGVTDLVQCPLNLPPGTLLSQQDSRCTIWHLSLVLVNLVQECYHDITQWLN